MANLSFITITIHLAVFVLIFPYYVVKRCFVDLPCTRYVTVMRKIQYGRNTKSQYELDALDVSRGCRRCLCHDVPVVHRATVPVQISHARRLVPATGLRTPAQK